MLRAMGHVGLWPGLYAVGALVCVAQLSGLWVPPGRLLWAALSVLLTAGGAYLLDRVKLRDAWIDPADIAAQPERYAFLVARSRALRAAAFASLGMGAWAGSTLSRYAPLSALLAAAGVVAYAAKPRGRVARPKDVVWTKNLYVAAGITSFAGLAAVAAASSVDGPAGWVAAAKSHGPGFLTACALVGARVLLDAALCDIDDEGTDSAHGTHTFSTRWGVARAWWVTGAARAALMAAVALARPCPWPARAVWACAMAMGTVALRLRRPARLRDLVDARFFVEAAGATAMLASWQMG